MLVKGDEITYTFPNCNDYTVAIYFVMNVIIYPRWDYNNAALVKWAPAAVTGIFRNN